MIYIQFRKTHDRYGSFSDIIELADDHALTDEEIDAIWQQRYNGWVVYMDEYIAKTHGLE
jgi:hypothetical protein